MEKINDLGPRRGDFGSDGTFYGGRHRGCRGGALRTREILPIFHKMLQTLRSFFAHLEIHK